MVRLWGSLLSLIVLLAAQAAYALTYEEIATLIKDKHINSISELLSHLPPEYRSEFTLVMKTKSVQGASVDSPRVLMFGTDAKLIMAFNGSPKQARYDHLEMIQFRDNEKRFEFFDIQFPERDDNGQPLNRLTAPVFSKANPSLCLSCHTSDPRPNWSHYSTWPGVFLGDDDNKNLAADTDFPTLDKYIEVMRTEYPLHPRYKYLEKAVDGFSYGGFRPSNHNLDFTERANNLNFQRVSRLLKSTPHYNEYKYIYAGILQCQTDGFVPDHFPKFGRTTDGFGEADFRDVFAKRGLYIGDFYLDLNTKDPVHFTSPYFFPPELTYQVVKGDPDLEPFYNFGSVDQYSIKIQLANVRDCNEVAKASRVALAKVKSPDEEMAMRQTHQPNVLQKCMKCHASPGMDGPQLPFDNEARLKAHFTSAGYHHGQFVDELLYRISEDVKEGERMPPDGMSRGDREQLTKYIRDLAAKSL